MYAFANCAWMDTPCDEWRLGSGYSATAIQHKAHSLAAPEPLPNPVMEEPIRHILGLTQKKLQDVIGGKEQINGKTGVTAIGAALAAINLPRALENARADIKSGKKTLRDKAVRRLGYLKNVNSFREVE